MMLCDMLNSGTRSADTAPFPVIAYRIHYYVDSSLWYHDRHKLPSSI